jgi:hypothetical protein
MTLHTREQPKGNDDGIVAGIDRRTNGGAAVIVINIAKINVDDAARGRRQGGERGRGRGRGRSLGRGSGGNGGTVSQAQSRGEEGKVAPANGIGRNSFREWHESEVSNCEE